MNRFNTEPWFQGWYLREGKRFYDRLPEMAASEIIFHMPRKFPIPTARLITYFTPNNHRHWIYNSPRFFDSIYECIIILLLFFNITVKHFKTYRTHRRNTMWHAFHTRFIAMSSPSRAVCGTWQQVTAAKFKASAWDDMTTRPKYINHHQFIINNGMNIGVPIHCVKLCRSFRAV